MSRALQRRLEKLAAELEQEEAQVVLVWAPWLREIIERHVPPRESAGPPVLPKRVLEPELEDEPRRSTPEGPR
jgi:hypothetical protein